MASALIPRFFRFCTWSFMRAINGVMTRQSPSLASAGTWKVMDFPPPVGISPKVSRPSVMLLMISSWIPRKVSYPQYCFRSLTPNPSPIGRGVLKLLLLLMVLLNFLATSYRWIDILSFSMLIVVITYLIASTNFHHFLNIRRLFLFPSLWGRG